MRSGEGVKKAVVIDAVLILKGSGKP